MVMTPLDTFVIVVGVALMFPAVLGVCYVNCLLLRALNRLVETAQGIELRLSGHRPGDRPDGSRS
jgi:hypothetical protein